MMIVLAETIDGLDALAAGLCANIQGSPLLLHMWICYVMSSHSFALIECEPIPQPFGRRIPDS